MNESRRVLVSFVCVVTAVAIVFAGAEVAFAQRVQLKFAHPFPPASPQGHVADIFKEQLERRTNAYEVKLFPAGQLGGSRDLLEALSLGTIDAYSNAAGIYGLFAPRLLILDLPFVWTSEDAMWKVLDGPLGQELLQSLEAKNIKAVSFGASGFKHLLNNKRPIRGLEDLKGLKMRIFPSPLLQTQFRLWGASPTSIDFNELFTALQQGVVDGQEQPTVTVVQMKFYEVQKYMTLSRHGFIHFIQAFNKKWYEAQSRENQQILIQAMKEAAQWQRRAIAEQSAGALRQIKENGVQVIELTPEAREEFRKASLKVHESFSEQIGKDLLQRTYAEISKFSK